MNFRSNSFKYLSCIIVMCFLNLGSSALSSTYVNRLGVNGSVQIPSTFSVTPIYGVTIDSVTDLPLIVQSFQNLSRRPTVRIVFDEQVSASYYSKSVEEIAKVADVMGEILDSSAVKSYSVNAYLKRTKEYLNRFSNTVKIWEIGNEINGEWLGGVSNVRSKMIGAYDLVKERGKIAALTLYYNEDCWASRKNEVFTWAEKNIPQKMKSGLDYVWISYYEDDCNDLQPDWNSVFKKLSVMFPNSKIGFGEVGTKYANRKVSYINRYYNMQIDLPNYVGGYFWWYYKQDMVPYTKPLWKVLNTAISFERK